MHRNIKSILIVSLELVQKVLRSSFAKLVILLKEIAYAVFDLPGALFFPYNSYLVWWIALRGCRCLWQLKGCWEGALSRSSTAVKSHNFTIHLVKYRYCLQGSSRYVSVLGYFYSSGDYLPLRFLSYEPVHEISDSVVCANSKASDQPTHTRSLIRAFACRLNII